MSVLLTKSKFTHSLECLTKLYYKNHPREYASSQDDNDFLMALAEGGIQVGELAKLYYPGGFDLPYSRDKTVTLNKTRELLQKEEVIIYEAAIQHDLTYALVDVLVKKGNRIELIEVKSKSWADEEGFYNAKGVIKPEWHKYLYDIAFQTWVMQKAYPEFEVHPKLMLIDKNRPATIDGLHQYFKITKDGEGRSEVKLSDTHFELDLGDPIMKTVDVAEEYELIMKGELRNPQSDLEAKGFDQWINGLCDLIRSDEKYSVTIGAKCKNCEHRVSATKLDGKKAGFDECWMQALNWNDSDLLEPHIFDVWNERGASKLLDSEMYKMKELTPEYYGINKSRLYQKSKWTQKERKLAQVMKMTGRHDPEEVILPGLFHEMDTWTFPLHFIDFEGIAPAIPFHKGTYPYKKVPFQFSVHDVLADGSIQHVAEWVEQRPGVFPCFNFVRELKKVLEHDEGTVFMYHHYERTTLNDVKAMLQGSTEPDKEELIAFIDTLVNDDSPRRMIDQQKLVLQYYYSVHMGKSNSIKDVLPAVLTESAFLKDYYSKPYSGLSIKDKVLYKEDTDGKAINPYKLLDPIALESIPDPIDIEDLETDESAGSIADGGTAMMAWARMQFEDITSDERNATFAALLRYCELDTLAMVMIYQHWNHYAQTID